MKRISFLQGMLVGFVFIVSLLGGVAMNGWLLLETLVGERRENSALAVELSAAIQTLNERSVDVERSARQYRVLGDNDLRRRFQGHLEESYEQLGRIEELAAPGLGDVPSQWRGVAKKISRKLARHNEKTEEDLAVLLDRLGSLNTQVAQAGQRWIDSENTRLIQELDNHRIQLGVKLALALIGAVSVALVMGWWLLRPVHQLDRAIRRLGARRFDEEISVGGPIDLRRLGRRLDWLRQHLAELESDRQKTLRHVSHELKTPLTALKEGAALLAEEVPGPLSPGQREVVGIMAHNVLGLQGRIESLLGLNAAIFDARQLDMVRTEAGQLLREVASRHELRAQTQQIRIAQKIDPGEVRLDPGKMALILDNLLANAIDFSPQGGEIILTARRVTGAWYFDCIDAGCGVAPDDSERIFQPFVQGRLKAPVERRGSGVGLSIVRELANAMGGKVDLLASAQGAHFRVEIPDAN
ncbi:MAG: sensor histidine kinase [Azonexus sp.]